MASWDDTMVENDGDELVDWLWDLPDSYDVGYDDEPAMAASGVTTVGTSRVRKHLRRQGGLAGDEDGSSVDWPTQGMDAIDASDGDGGTAFYPAYRYRRGRPITTNKVVGVAAVVFVLAGVAGLAYALLHHGASNNVNIDASQTTTTFVEQAVIPTVTVSPSTDTSTSLGDTTTSASSVPGATQDTTPYQAISTQSPTGTIPTSGTTRPTGPGTTTATVPATTTTVPATTTIPATTTTPPPTTTTVPATTTTVPATTTTAHTTTTT